MNVQEIQDFIIQNQDNEEVQGLIKSFVTKDTVESFLDGEQGWGVLQPRFDKQFQKSLNTWKQNNLQEIIESEIKTRFPDETPEAKKNRELEQRLAAMEKKEQRANLRATAIQFGSELGLPPAIVDACIGETEEDTRNNLRHMETEFKNAVELTMEKRMGERHVPAGGGKPATPDQEYASAYERKDAQGLLAAKLNKLI